MHERVAFLAPHASAWIEMSTRPGVRARACTDRPAARRCRWSGHEHGGIFWFLDLVAQHGREIEHDRFFEFAAYGFGAVIDAAMAGIDHDERTRIFTRGGRRNAGRPRERTALDRDGAHEGIAVAGSEVDARDGPAGRRRPRSRRPSRPAPDPRSITMREPPCMTRP